MTLPGPCPNVFCGCPEHRPLLMGQAAGAVEEILPAKDIVDSMVAQAAEILGETAAMVRPAAKL